MSQVIYGFSRGLRAITTSSLSHLRRETVRNSRNESIHVLKSRRNNSRLICNCCRQLPVNTNFVNKRIYYERIRQFSSTLPLNSKHLSENEYEAIADETLDSLTEMFEDLPEKESCDPEYDTQYGSGVLTVKISDDWGTYVINKQTPNKQIWLSSPISGPKRYDFEDGTWVYKHDQMTLHKLLSEEISQALDKQLDFTVCSYGSAENS